MNNEIKISVIIPVYNAGQFLNKCIDSVLAQTFKDFELICVNDASTDTSPDILNEYARKDSRVKVFSFKQNRKQGAARNAGLKVARGKYITFIDADDYISENLLEKMYDKAEKHCCDLVVTSVINEPACNDAAVLELTARHNKNYESCQMKSGFYLFDFCTNDVRTSPWAKLYKKEIIEANKIQFPENLIQEDEAFYWFFMPFVDNVYYIDEPLYFRLVHSSSTMYELIYNHKREYDNLAIIKKIVKFYKQHKLYNLYKEKLTKYVYNVISGKEESFQKCYFVSLIFFSPELLKPYFENFITEIKFLSVLFKLRNKRIVFWGASIFLENVLKKYHIKNSNILGIVDKDSTKQDKTIGIYQIFPPEKLAEINPDFIVFAIKNNSSKIYPQIEKYLHENLQNVKLYPNIFKEIKSIILQKERLTPHKTFKNIEFHVVEHCNLSCKGCNHFSSLAEKKFANVQDFESDIKRLSGLTNQKIKRFCLLGGEPLLHPNIIDFMRITRKYLPDTRITMLSNGILLNAQTSDFWRACAKYNIVINITKYPINLDFDKMASTAQQYNVEFGYFSNSAEVVKTSDLYPIDVNGKGNMQDNFSCCMLANHCIFLKNGHIYTCAVAPNIEHFNKFFKQNIPLTEKDGINIYKAKSAKQILKFLAKPIPFCKYCNVKERIQGKNKWEVSKKVIEEWT